MHPEPNLSTLPNIGFYKKWFSLRPSRLSGLVLKNPSRLSGLEFKNSLRSNNL